MKNHIDYIVLTIHYFSAVEKLESNVKEVRRLMLT